MYKLMAFTRRSLSSYGLTEEQVEKVMALHGTSMADFVPKADVQAQIDAAVADAKKNAPAPNIKESDDYKALQQDYENYKKKIEVSAELKKSGVKEKFLDSVYSLLEDGNPAADQLDAIREQYEEYFDMQTPPPASTGPQFGAQVKGQMPGGQKPTSFEDVWGLSKK